MERELTVCSCQFTQVSEIAFINTLEAQNKKMEVMERYQVRLIMPYAYTRVYHGVKCTYLTSRVTRPDCTTSR